MDRLRRSAIERATQRARALLEEDFHSQLEGTYDMLPSGTTTPRPPVQLSAEEAASHAIISAAIERKTGGGMDRAEALRDYVRDAAFTTLNRFTALKMLEARGLVQQCVSRGEQSSGYAEFTGMAPGLPLLPDSRGYRLYLESLFDELSTEVKVLFDRRDPASVLWPRRAALEQLLQVLNARELDQVWAEDETIGWVYQYFNREDERRQMRKESPQAPRNSRELAVRNQFFTPRYVVQFLTDNTLGRTWLEMQGETTKLAETCEYLVRPTGKPIGSRLRKDPRDLRVLDPACGSGHFLLYAFDLLLAIYEEGWGVDDAEAPRSDLTGRTLQEDYPDLPELRRAAPGLIVEHNLYGVDIDARCAQIAALALWLRAQRAYQDLGIPAGSRPRIRRTHIVVAEPMPGSQDLATAFAAELDQPFQRTLFNRMIEEMRLAGELGSLLQVERSLAEDLGRARQQFLAQEQTTLPGFEPKLAQGKLDLSGVTDETVFHDAEEAILAALRRFAESAGGTDTRRRLFAGDAAQGVALIDLLRTKFDVVLMNPPFGAVSAAAKTEFEKAHPRTKNDIYAAFVERGVQLLRPRGLLGAITSRSGFFLSTFQAWREDILLKEAPPILVADLGYGVMDAATVEAAAYCIEKVPPDQGGKILFMRILAADDKARALRRAIHPDQGSSDGAATRFEIDQRMISSVPRSPFAYWVDNHIRLLFTRLPALEGNRLCARRGASTGGDFRRVRLWWEVLPTCRSSWPPFSKGGAFSHYYFDAYLVVAWDAQRHTYAAFTGRPGRRAERLESSGYYFRPGVTWPLRTQRGLSFRAMPAGCVFGHKGPSAFAANDDHSALLSLLAVANSRTFRMLVNVQMAFGSYEVGVIQRTPVPDPSLHPDPKLASLALSAWSLRHSLDAHTETSHAFVLPALLEAGMLANGTAAWSSHVLQIEAKLTTIQAEIEARCLDLYSVDAETRIAIMAGLQDGDDVIEVFEPEADPGTEDETDDEAEDEPQLDASALTAEFLSWAVGTSFGRFDVRLATGARSLPAEPEPFAPLPVCSPGMLAGDDGLPLARPPAGYPLSFPDDGILVDDPGHPRDLIAAVRTVLELVLAARAETFWQEAAGLLDPRDHDLRGWLASGFFDDHLHRYSRRPRKGPILWQLAVPSGRYSVWCYAHRMTPDSLFVIQNDFVAPKLVLEERRLSSLRTDAGDTPAANLRAEIADQEAFVDELRTLLDEIRRVALCGIPISTTASCSSWRPCGASSQLTGLGSGSFGASGRSSSPARTTGRTSRCTSGPNVSYLSARPTGALQSPTTSKTSSGARAMMASGSPGAPPPVQWRNWSRSAPRRLSRPPSPVSSKRPSRPEGAGGVGGVPE